MVELYCEVTIGYNPRWRLKRPPPPLGVVGAGPSGCLAAIMLAQLVLGRKVIIVPRCYFIRGSLYIPALLY